MKTAPYAFLSVLISYPEYFSQNLEPSKNSFALMLFKIVNGKLVWVSDIKLDDFQNPYSNLDTSTSQIVYDIAFSPEEASLYVLYGFTDASFVTTYKLFVYQITQPNTVVTLKQTLSFGNSTENIRYNRELWFFKDFTSIFATEKYLLLVSPSRSVNAGVLHYYKRPDCNTFCPPGQVYLGINNGNPMCGCPEGTIELTDTGLLQELSGVNSITNGGK